MGVELFTGHASLFTFASGMLGPTGVSSVVRKMYFAFQILPPLKGQLGSIPCFQHFLPIFHPSHTELPLTTEIFLSHRPDCAIPTKTPVVSSQVCNSVPAVHSVPGLQDAQSGMLGGDHLENKVNEPTNKVVHMNNNCHERNRG